MGFDEVLLSEGDVEYELVLCIWVFPLKLPDIKSNCLPN